MLDVIASLPPYFRRGESAERAWWHALLDEGQMDNLIDMDGIDLGMKDQLALDALTRRGLIKPVKHGYMVNPNVAICRIIKDERPHQYLRNIYRQRRT